MRKNAATAPIIIPAVVSQNANCIKSDRKISVRRPSDKGWAALLAGVISAPAAKGGG